MLGKVRENSPLGAPQSLGFSAYHSSGTPKSLHCQQPWRAHLAPIPTSLSWTQAGSGGWSLGQPLGPCNPTQSQQVAPRGCASGLQPGSAPPAAGGSLAGPERGGRGAAAPASSVGVLRLLPLGFPWFSPSLSPSSPGPAQIFPRHPGPAAQVWARKRGLVPSTGGAPSLRSWLPRGAITAIREGGGAGRGSSGP